MRNMLATLLLSQGVPMLLAGDEFGRSQGGNNNAYCQDNDVGWVDWGAVDQGLLDYVRRLIRLRREHPVFRRPHFFKGDRLPAGQLKDITWVTPEGTEMTNADWTAPFARSLGFVLGGEACVVDSRDGVAQADDTYMVLLNAYTEILFYTLPPQMGECWDVLVDTARTDPIGPEEVCTAGSRFPLKPHSLAVLRKREGERR
jgi:glycogen operon protein